MAAVIALLLIAISVGLYVATPLLRKDTALTSEALDERLHELEEQKEMLYSVIKEVEFDYQMQKLSKEDYVKLKDRLSREAALILEQIESHQTTTP